MDTRTGDIMPLSEMQLLPAEEQKHFVEIPPHMVEMLKRCSRKDRRAWFFDNRKILGLKTYAEFTTVARNVSEKNNPIVTIPRVEHEKLKEDAWKYRELSK